MSKAKKKKTKSTRQERTKKTRREIEKEKRFNLSNFIIRLILIIILSICCLLLYSRYTATTGLITNEYKITNNKIPDSFNGFKIIQISDIRYGSTVDNKYLKEIVTKINDIDPDLVVFTGDLIDNNYKLKNQDVDDITSILKEINSYAGKYACDGDLDNTESYLILQNSEFKLLDNNYDTIYYKDYTPIIISGTGSSLKNNINLENTFKYLTDENNNNLFQISLIHESDAAVEILNTYSPDIIMTGNSLGGLVRIPYIGNIYNLEGSKKITKRITKEHDTIIYNSYGIGTNKYKFRLFNRPSVNLYRLYNK